MSNTKQHILAHFNTYTQDHRDGPAECAERLNNCLAIVWRELATEKTSSDNCRAAAGIHLLVHISATRFARYCPDIVQVLSGSCLDIVRILSESSNITKLQRGQNWTYIQRLIIS